MGCSAFRVRPKNGRAWTVSSNWVCYAERREPTYAQWSWARVSTPHGHDDSPRARYFIGIGFPWSAAR